MTLFSEQWLEVVGSLYFLLVTLKYAMLVRDIFLTRVYFYLVKTLVGRLWHVRRLQNIHFRIAEQMNRILLCHVFYIRYSKTIIFLAITSTNKMSAPNSPNNFYSHRTSSSHASAHIKYKQKGWIAQASHNHTDFFWLNQTSLRANPYIFIFISTEGGVKLIFSILGRSQWKCFTHSKFWWHIPTIMLCINQNSYGIHG